MTKHRQDLLRLVEKTDSALLAERDFYVRWDLYKVRSRAIKKLQEMEVVG